MRARCNPEHNSDFSRLSNFKNLKFLLKKILKVVGNHLIGRTIVSACTFFAQQCDTQAHKNRELRQNNKNSSRLVKVLKVVELWNVESRKYCDHLWA